MVKINYTYETQTGTEFHANVECLGFDDAMEAAEKVIDWCEICGYRMRRIDVYDIKEV